MSRPVTERLRGDVSISLYNSFNPLVRNYRFFGDRLWRIMSGVCNPLWSKIYEDLADE